MLSQAVEHVIARSQKREEVAPVQHLLSSSESSSSESEDDEAVEATQQINKLIEKRRKRRMRKYLTPDGVDDLFQKLDDEISALNEKMRPDPRRPLPPRGNEPLKLERRMTEFISIIDPKDKKPIRVLANEEGQLGYQYNAEDHSKYIAANKETAEEEEGAAGKDGVVPVLLQKSNTMQDMRELMLDDVGVNNYGLTSNTSPSKPVAVPEKAPYSSGSYTPQQREETDDEGAGSEGGGQSPPASPALTAAVEKEGWGNMRRKILKDKEEMVSEVIAANKKAQEDARTEGEVHYKMRMRYDSPTIKREPTKLTVKF